jgi:hypothetical protein
VLDTDADGVADEAVDGTSATGAFTIHRGSGDLVLTGANAADVVTGVPNGPSTGDVDGDSRSDVIVAVETAAGDLRHYLVRGSTPDGTHDVSSVGVLIAGWQPASVAYAPGDVDADGHDDLVITAVSTRLDGTTFDDTLVHRGALLAAAAPGSTSTEPLSLGARLVDLLPVDDARTMVAVATADEDSFEVTVWYAGTTIELTTAGQIVRPSFTGWPTARFGDAPDGRVWLVLDARGPIFNGGWTWRVADLCGVNG